MACPPATAQVHTRTDIYLDQRSKDRPAGPSSQQESRPQVIVRTSQASTPVPSASSHWEEPQRSSSRRLLALLPSSGGPTEYPWEDQSRLQRAHENRLSGNTSRSSGHARRTSMPEALSTNQSSLYQSWTGTTQRVSQAGARGIRTTVTRTSNADRAPDRTVRFAGPGAEPRRRGEPKRDSEWQKRGHW